MARISYIITRSDTLGGAHVHLKDLAARAQSDGHVVQVLTGGNGPYATLLRDQGLTVVNLRYLVRPIRPDLDVLGVLECWRSLRRFKPDLVHAHSTKAGLVGRLAARLAGVPVVFTAHGWAFSEGIAERSRRLAEFLERRAAHWSDAIICVSDYDRALALRLGVGTESLLKRIHNGVPDLAPPWPGARFGSDGVRIVSVARLDAPKDPLLLLDALATIKSIPWLLELIGDGPLTGAVQERALALGLSDRVTFSGLCNDVPARLARSDVFVLVSAWEGLPLSILEAMRGGLPVVASDVGGVSEAVQDSVTGFLVPKGDGVLLADRLARLLGDAALRLRMGQAGRTAYEREFGFEAMVQRTQQVYRDVLSRGAPR